MARLPLGCTAPCCSPPWADGSALGRRRSRCRVPRLPPGHRRKPLLLPDLVDDLEDTRVEPGVLDPELLGQAAPVHQVVAGLLAAALLAERDLSVREEPTHGVRQLAERHRDPARVGAG